MGGVSLALSVGVSLYQRGLFSRAILHGIRAAEGTRERAVAAAEQLLSDRRLNFRPG